MANYVYTSVPSVPTPMKEVFNWTLKSWAPGKDRALSSAQLKATRRSAAMTRTIHALAKVTVPWPLPDAVPRYFLGPLSTRRSSIIVPIIAARFYSIRCEYNIIIIIILNFSGAKQPIIWSVLMRTAGAAVAVAVAAVWENGFETTSADPEEVTRWIPPR